MTTNASDLIVASMKPLVGPNANGSKMPAAIRMPAKAIGAHDGSRASTASRHSRS